MKKKIVFVLAGLFVIILVAVAFGQYKPGMFSMRQKIQAPDFSLKDISGKTFRLSSLRGNPILMFFGATWCAACRGEMPYYKNLYQKYGGQGLKFVYIDVNESSQRVARFARENSFPYLVLVDEYGSVAENYNLIGVPTIFLLDKDRNIVGISHRVADLHVERFFPAIK
ncbi:MAG TPA: TlpA disulfide reductase family protein [Smithellaceae bacterium]|nr:TlpA disulfide reductase family protein [Smithellaceae bacterium]